MRISDWSSDVCSSDLDLPGRLRQANGSHGRRERTEAAGQPLRRPLGVAALAFQAVQAARRGDDVGGIDLNAQAGKIIGHCAFASLRCVSEGPPAPLRRTPSFRRSALPGARSEEHTSELQSLMRISYAVF